MAAQPSTTLWPAPPHTIAKIEILQDYLAVYFQILGRTRKNQNMLYIDGFAGPNEYTNYSKGSPSAALEAIQAAREKVGSAWLAGDLNCAFIEKIRIGFIISIKP